MLDVIYALRGEISIHQNANGIKIGTLAIAEHLTRKMIGQILVVSVESAVQSEKIMAYLFVKNAIEEKKR